MKPVPKTKTAGQAVVEEEAETAEAADAVEVVAAAEEEAGNLKIIKRLPQKLLIVIAGPPTCWGTKQSLALSSDDNDSLETASFSFQVA